MNRDDFKIFKQGPWNLFLGYAPQRILFSKMASCDNYVALAAIYAHCVKNEARLIICVTF